MAERNRKSRKIDPGKAAGLFFFLCVLVSAAAVSRLTGTDTVYYVFFPLSVCLAYLTAFLFAGSSFTAQQIGVRLSRSHYNDASLFYRSSLAASVVTGLLTAAVLSVFAKSIAADLFTGIHAYLLLYLAGAVCFLGSVLAVMHGFLQGTGLSSVSSAAMTVHGVLSLGFMTAGARIGNTNGISVGRLLRNAQYQPVYAAAGMLAGLLASQLLYFFFLLILNIPVYRQMERQMDSLAIDNDERFFEAARYVFVKMLPAGVAAFVPQLTMLLLHRIAAGNENTASFKAAVTVALPVTLGLSLLIAICHSRMISVCIADSAKGKISRLQAHFSMFVRLYAYAAIPAAVFTFAAGKPIVRLFYSGMTTSEKKTCVFAMRSLSPLVFLISLCILLIQFLWNRNGKLQVLISLTAGGICCLLSAFILRALGAGVPAVTIPVDAGAFATAGFLAVFCKRSSLRGLKGGWVPDVLLITFSSAAAAVPIVLMNNFLTGQDAAVPAILILGVIYIALYVILSLLVHAADLRNITKVPFGRLIYLAAKAMRLIAE